MTSTPPGLVPPEFNLPFHAHKQLMAKGQVKIYLWRESFLPPALSTLPTFARDILSESCQEGEAMLSRITKTRSGPLRLLYSVVALTILITTVSPVAASAAVRRPEPVGTQATYVNAAHATSQWNWFTDYSLKFQLRQSSASTINADDSAVALTSGCHDCGAIAIGFQVIFAPKQSLRTLNVNSAAQATSTTCVRCSTLAEVYEIVDISSTEQQLTRQQWAGLEYVGFELQALRFFHLSSDQVQSKVAELASQTAAILQDGTADPPARYVPSASPAINGPASTAPMTGASQPGVRLFVKKQSG